MSARCLVPNCSWTTGEPKKYISGCLATWHVYEEHPDVWYKQFGNRPPNDPDVRDPLTRKILEILDGVN
jgi:hypothetical protein